MKNSYQILAALCLLVLLFEKCQSRKIDNEGIQTWIAETLTKYSIPDTIFSAHQQISKQTVSFNNDTLRVSSEFKNYKTVQKTNLFVGIANIGKTYFEGDSIFYIMFLDNPLVGLRFKGNYNGKNDLQHKIVKAFDDLKLSYKNDDENKSRVYEPIDKRQQIEGEWNGTDESRNKATFIFDKNNKATFVSNNQVVGSEFERDGIVFDCIYDIDYTKSPIWLDISLRKKGEVNKKIIMQGIVRFITDTKIEYRVNFNGSRFKNFDYNDKKNTVVLDKVVK